MDLQKVQEKYTHLPLRARILLDGEHVTLKISDIAKNMGEETDAVEYIANAAAALASGAASYEETVDYLVESLNVTNEIARSLCSTIRKEILAPAQNALAEALVDITKIPLEG